MPAPSRQEQCPYCSRLFARRGLKQHTTSCKRNFDEQQADALYERELLQTAVGLIVSNLVSAEGESSPDPLQPFLGAAAVDETNSGSPEAPDQHTDDISASESVYNIDDIRTVYHPASSIPARVDHFEDYRSNPTFQAADPPIDPCPWRPFAMHHDFKLGEFILDVALTRKQMTTLFELLTPNSESTQGLASTIKSLRDFQEHWDQAANLITPFEKSTITIPLHGRDQTFDVYRRNLWTWALELIQNPTLEPHFFWDAVQLSKWNGKAFERFIDEPWTAQAFWDLQTPLPKGAKPLCFILYADKTRLSSFGTAQGYPVVALYQIKDDPRYKKKTYYVDFKRSVWHAAMKYILEPLEEPSKVPIISCVFEEAIWRRQLTKHDSCYVVLTRGTNGLKPCVICLVPKMEQYNLHINYELRTSVQTREILGDTAGLPTKGAQNKFLSGFGLRNIQNAFWNVTDCDPFRSLSWDRLHAHNDGLFGKHLRGEIVARVAALGMQFTGQADDQIKLFPCWKDFYHFDSGFMGVNFTDGMKYEDLAKHILFVTQNILTETCDKHGYHLLKCMRSYLELNTYAAFNLHTETTMQAIQDELIKFSELIKEYEQLTMSVKPKAKSWNFPKIHSHKHLVDDIMAKGVTRNYNTKPNKKMHISCGPISRKLRNRFCVWIRGGGGTYKMKELPISRAHDAAYGKFKDRLSAFMVGQFAKHPKIVPLVSGEKISFKAFKDNDECSLDFYNHPRYDCVIVEGLEGHFFAETIMLFSCTIGGESFPLALVHPFNEPVGASNAKLDKDLGFYRVWARQRKNSTFVSIYNIIRGALLVEDYGFKSADGMKEYLVVDCVDDDLFLRMKSLKYIGRRGN
ncbi:hypothetical protein IW261DRAFT_1422042 [Armillaria novae-zelandiae]|uniref:Uncharacterized protein n=1 Tax=Armillaria novae-zelandiae TaxID=153914 RepID=A0AA39UEJ8_9AGAR|nr:hypothetical protein IW261DRAFT_1422042 [Armillaria novae-zelandiae]